MVSHAPPHVGTPFRRNPFLRRLSLAYGVVWLWAAIAPWDRQTWLRESLLVLAREGRQIFYLTCNPADVGHWQAIAAESGAHEPHVIDLAAARRLGGGAPDSAALRLPEREEVPAPDGVSPAEYATRLGVAFRNRFGVTPLAYRRETRTSKNTTG